MDDFEDQSYWLVGRVEQVVDPLKVAGEVGRMLVQVFGCSGEILNVWVEEGTTVRMIALVVPMTVARGRKALAEKLREENKDIRRAKRMPKAWGGAKVMGFIFDAADSTEVIRLVKTGIMWDGKRRKVVMFE
ncbi:hypothetical protein L211DRAFT_850950 [Terfezia boudieri ATCC MYA-4762]|uniref:Uncharacterized protein n=1 Tax=Terfezia boudieri ATCC MYA-4762 TaxID=1051890 RepID=A0A3N4LGG8_9PEZI|nr:hypothetical protein L211DRAFT_850950 [Terfezia boudieri ATCC MYA-4762]